MFFALTVGGGLLVIIGLLKMAIASYYSSTDPSRGTGYNFAGGVLIAFIGFAMGLAAVMFFI